MVQTCDSGLWTPGGSEPEPKTMDHEMFLSAQSETGWTPSWRCDGAKLKSGSDLHLESRGATAGTRDAPSRLLVLVLRSS